RIVPVRRRILDVARRNRHDLRLVTTPLRFARLRHFVIRHELRPALVGRHLRQRRRQRRLAVVDVTDGAHVHVGLGTVDFPFGHDGLSRGSSSTVASGYSRLAAFARRAEPELAFVWPRSGPDSSGAKAGADDRDRTGDLVLTEDVLCQLSYIGVRRVAAAADRSARPPCGKLLILLSGVPP